MSHFVTIHTQIRDIDALRDACGELGLALLQDSTARGFATQSTPGQYVVRLKGPYDIALNRASASEPFVLTTDWWDGHVAKEVGVGYGRLLQAYGIHKTFREAHARGLRATRRLEADGSVLVTLEGGAL